MNITKSGRSLLIHLHESERELLSIIFCRLEQQYKLSGAEWEDSLQKLWMPADLITAGGYEEEREYWEEHRAELSSERAKLSFTWAKSLDELRSLKNIQWRIEPEQVENLLKILNDYRLWTACLKGLTEQDMQDFDQSVEKSHKQQALLEVNFLAALIEFILHVDG
ncbi:MAG: hypothetical protein SH807_06450 [Blastochloris sp.]|nr:hypothetical protein [Blastochloris sp.]